MIVILGTAHQMNTPGKRSPDGRLIEYRWSREICEAIKAELAREGIECVIDYLDDIIASTSSQELLRRVQTVNAICNNKGYKNCMYISVHVNAAGSDGEWHNARGWSVYTSKGVTQADRLATEIYNCAKQVLPHDNKSYVRQDTRDGDPDFESDFYVLKHTKCIAVLTENLFMDNRDDVEYLLSDAGKKDIVNIHTQAIFNYLKKI